MIAILVCLGQLTLIATLAIVASNWTLSRAPKVAAQICGLGIFLAGAVVVATCFNIPRLWTFAPLPAVAASHSPERFSPHLPEREISSGGNSELSDLTVTRLNIDAMLEQLTQFRQQHAGLESTIASYCTVFAIAVGVVLLCRCFLGWLWLLRLRTAREITPQAELLQELNELVSTSGLRSGVKLFESDCLSSPCVNWVSRGRIYVPMGFEQWSSAERSTALAHELAHQIRWDPQWRLAAEMCLSLVCFHPLLHMLRRKLVFAQELATDQRAAQLLGSLNQYRCGLTLLALRMDSQRTASCLVSVSTNDVVRRIKMLSVTKPSLRRWQEVFAVATVGFASVFISAWHASADDTLRVASRERASVPSPESSDASKPLLPWEDLGEQDGYLVVRPNELIQRDVFSALYRKFVEVRLRSMDLNGTGLAPESIRSMQLPLLVDIKKVAPEEAVDGKKHQLFAECNGLALEASSPIGWKKIATQLPPLPGQPEATEWLKTELSANDGRPDLLLLSPKAENRHLENSDKLRSVWLQACSTSSLAAACIVPAAFSEEIEDESDVVGIRELLGSAAATAIALDLNPQSGVSQVQLVFAPADAASAAELTKRIAATREKVLGVARAAASLGLNGEQDRGKLECVNQILEALSAASIDTLTNAQGDELVVVRLETRADLMALLQ